MRSPHAQGSTEIDGVQYFVYVAFPACAGINLSSPASINSRDLRSPHAQGSTDFGLNSITGS